MEELEQQDKLNQNASNLLTYVGDEEVFKFLKKVRYDRKFSVWREHLGKEDAHGIFFETIVMLENLQRSIRAIFNKAKPTKDEYIDAIKHQDQSTIQSILEFFESLRLNNVLLEYASNHSFSGLVISFLQYLQFHQDAPFNKAGDAWTQKTFPVDAAFDCIEQYEVFLTKHGLGQNITTVNKNKHSYTSALNSSEARINRQYTEILSRYQEALDAFQEIEENKKLKKVYVLYLSVDFNLLDPHKDWSSPFMNIHLDPIFRSLEGYIRNTSDVLMYFIDYDYRMSNVMVMDIIIVLEYSQNLQLPQLFETIQQVIEISIGTAPIKVYVRNLNEAIKRKFKDKSAVGILNLSKKALHDFKYWLLNCFYYKDLMISENYEAYFYTNQLVASKPGIKLYSKKLVKEKQSKHEIQTDKTLYREVRNLSLPVLPEASQYLKESDVIAILKDKPIWHDRELPSSIQKQLHGLHTLYAEQKEQYGWSLEQVDALNKIELLMQMLRYYRPLTDISIEHLNAVSTKPMTHLSLVEKQYLDVANWIECLVAVQKKSSSGDLDMDFVEQYHQQLSWRITAFIQFWKDHHSIAPSERLTKMINLSLKDTFSGICRYLKELHVIANTVDMIKQEKQIILNALKNKEAGTCYLRQSLKKDVWLCRFQLWYDFTVYDGSTDVLSDSVDRYKAFSLLLSDFLKNIQRSPRRVGGHLVGYIGSYISLDKPKVDLVFIFRHEEESLDIIDHQEERVLPIAQYWEGYIQMKEKILQKNVSKKNNPTSRTTKPDSLQQYLQYLKHGQLRSQIRPVMARLHELNHERFTIYHSSTELKPVFIKNVADHYAAYAFLLSNELLYQKLSNNVFLKGRAEYQPRQKNTLSVTHTVSVPNEE